MQMGRARSAPPCALCRWPPSTTTLVVRMALGLQNSVEAIWSRNGRLGNFLGENSEAGRGSQGGQVGGGAVEVGVVHQVLDGLQHLIQQRALDQLKLQHRFRVIGGERVVRFGNFEGEILRQKLEAAALSFKVQLRGRKQKKISPKF
ncbi:hypothetical protein FF1_031949 [Malus domestica]